jgi:hypothetical protein
MRFPRVQHALWVGVPLVAVLAAVMVVRAAGDGAPARAIPYVGTLDHNGDPFDGAIGMIFRLHDDATAGAHLFTQTETVMVHAGKFAVVLGSQPGNPLPESAFTARALFVSTEVGGALLSGRQQVFAATQAVRAGQADTLRVSSTISAPSRLHIGSDNEDVYLLPKGRVVVGKEWGGTGNMWVQGSFSAAGMSATAMDIGDLKLRPDAQLTAGNAVGNFHIDANNPAGADGRIYLGFYSGNGVVFGNHKASVDKDGNVSAANVTVSGAVNVGHFYKHDCGSNYGYLDCTCPPNYRVLGGGAECATGYLWVNRGISETTWRSACTFGEHHEYPKTVVNMTIMCARLGN